MGVNAYFVPRQTNRPHSTPNYGPGNKGLKYTIIDKHIFIQENWIVSQKNWGNQVNKEFVIIKVSIITIWSLLVIKYDKD